MKQTLQTKLSQHLALTPQLQQAIRLLQLSSIELTQEIELAVENNPLLEYDEEANTPQEEPAQPDRTDNSQELTDRWDDIRPSRRSDFAEGPQAYEIQGVTTTDLGDHLHWQLRLSHFSELDAAIGTAIIDSIDGDGFLQSPLEDIRTSLGDIEIEVDDDEIETVLHRIQNFDPTGVGARDLKECLLLQLKTLPENTPYLFEAQSIIHQDLELLAHHDYRNLLKKHKIKESQLQSIIALIQNLNPKPGASISPLQTEYVTPDLVVDKYQGQWRIRANGETLPKLQLNKDYNHLIDKKTHEKEYDLLHEHLQEAKWFMKSVDSRNSTLLRVGENIMKHQQGFLEHGEEQMKPLILQNIADDLDLHESTISRITTQKYVLTPRGLFELKYFFSSHLATDGSEDCSSTAIRAMIKKYIEKENSHKPLSDNKMTQMLSKEGIHVARRTVAKYREEMAIPPSNERKIL